MNVAIFASAFHPHFGGVEELVRQLALELQRQGHGAIVLTNRWPRTLPAHEVFDGISVYRVAFRAPGSGPKSVMTFAISRGAIDREVSGILRRTEANIVHVQCVGSNGYYARRASRALGLPMVVTLQGELTMDATRLFERSRFARSTLRDCMADAHMVTGCSGKTLADGERFFGRSLGGRGRVIFNGASVSDFNSVPPYRCRRPYILAIGRLVRQKGFDVLLHAFAESGATRSHDLVIAGEGSEHSTLTALAVELGLAESANFLGRADRSLVPALFVGSEFVVVPSTADEGLPVVLAEALAAGKAVIATQVGGVPEIVRDGRNGLVVAPSHVGTLAAAIDRLVNDVGLRDRLARNVFLEAAEFTWPVIVRKYLDVYSSASSTTRT